MQVRLEPGPRLRLNSRLLPLLVGLLLVLHIVEPNRVWRILLIGLGGAWLLSSSLHTHIQRIT